MSLWRERRDNRTAHDGNDRAKGRKWTVSVVKTAALAALSALWPALSRHCATTCPLLWTAVAWHTTDTAVSNWGQEQRDGGPHPTAVGPWLTGLRPAAAGPGPARWFAMRPQSQA